MKKIRVGLIGTGGVMGYNHLPGYRVCDNCEITAICDINPETLRTVGEKLNVPEKNRFLKYEDLMDSGLVDIVDIATPDNVHCEIAEAAVRRGIPFSTEKPMGMNYKEVKSVCDHAAEKNLPGMVCFTWHYRPYIRKMHDLMKNGLVGQVYHVYIRCIKDSGLWEGRRLEWRFDEKQSASGVMGDLSSHMFDIARFLGQEFEAVSADAGIFVKERRELNSEKMVPVTTWDWCNVLAKMRGGANATFQISRTTKYISDWIQVEVYGDKGRLYYEWLGGQQKLEIQDEKGKIERIIPDAAYDAVQSRAFLNISQGIRDEMDATLENALKCQAVLDAAYRSVKEGRWVTIAEIEKEAE